jgi:hypothetical protein
MPNSVQRTGIKIDHCPRPAVVPDLDPIEMPHSVVRSLIAGGVSTPPLKRHCRGHGSSAVAVRRMMVFSGAASQCEERDVGNASVSYPRGRTSRSPTRSSR